MPKLRGVGNLLAAIFAVALIASIVWKPKPPVQYTGLKESEIPYQVGPFQGVDLPVDQVTRQALASADIISRQYTAGVGDIVDMTIIGGTDRSALHDPRSCLVGAGWRIEDDHVEGLPNTTPVVYARACHAFVGKSHDPDDPSEIDSGQAFDIMYLYICHGKVVASASDIRFALLQSALLDQNESPIYFIRVLMPLVPISQGEAASEAQHQELSVFIAQLWNEIGPTLLKSEQ